MLPPKNKIKTQTVPEADNLTSPKFWIFFLSFVWRNFTYFDDSLILRRHLSLRDIYLWDIVRDTHGGGWSRNINARYLHTLMVYL
jgi:hypothetical protein